ncbi:MAG: hypothetical protein LUH54_02330 [Firmicutes bacterium]|nr:hypothetical protein [Bacillota bacterium]
MSIGIIHTSWYITIDSDESVSAPNKIESVAIKRLTKIDITTIIVFTDLT